MTRKINTILAAAICTIFAGSASATEMRYATAAPLKTPWGAYLVKTTKAAEKASKGSLKFNVFYGSQLGDEQTAIRQVVRGRIDISGQSNTATSLVVPEIALLSAPYLFKDTKQSDCVFDNHVQPIFGPMLYKRGLILVSYVEVGYGTVFSQVPIKNADQAKNLKMRVPPSSANTLFWKAVGAAGVPLGVVDMVPALKTGQVKAIHTAAVYGLAIGLPKLAPHIIYAKTHHDIGTVTISKKTWKKMPASERKAAMVMANYVNELRRNIRGAEQFLLAKAEKAGAKVHRPSGADMASFQSYAQQASDALVRKIGRTAPAIWQKILDAKKACGG